MDIEALRRDTPGTAEVAHLNNAAGSLAPEPVVEAAVAYTRLEARLGAYESAAEWANRFTAMAASGARLLGCEADDWVVTGSASEAWWRSFLAAPVEAGDTIITGRAEFVSSAAGLFQAADRGVNVVTIPNDPDGHLDLDFLAENLDASVKLVCLTQVPMTRGIVHPVSEAATIVHDRSDALVLVDGAQALGQIPVDVTEIDCDFYAATGRKWLRAPRGTGLLYVSPRAQDRLNPAVFVDGSAGAWSADASFTPHPGAAGFGFGERPWSAIAGLAEAIDYTLALGIDAIAAQIEEIASYARTRLAGVPGVDVHDGAAAATGIVSITVQGYDPTVVVMGLRQHNIHTAPPGRATSYHDLADRGLAGIVRVSPHYFNTTDEIDRLAETLEAEFPPR